MIKDRKRRSQWWRTERWCLISTCHKRRSFGVWETLVE